jgi:type II secretory pathway pseudopilin PulG
MKIKIKKIKFYASLVKGQRSNVNCASRGFTLIETFVAISILMIAIVGPITLGQRSINSANLTKDKLTAYFLAQDAIEYIRNVRDDAAISGGGWAEFATTISDSENCRPEPDPDYPEFQYRELPQCIIDTTHKNYSDTSDPSKAAIRRCEWPNGCANLNYDATRGVYSYGAGAVSPFKRGIKIVGPPQSNPNDEDKEAFIEVTVNWTSQGYGAQSIILRDSLLDW